MINLQYVIPNLYTGELAVSSCFLYNVTLNVFKITNKGTATSNYVVGVNDVAND